MERDIVEAMSEKLVADGMFFVGIDVIGDKVVEINAESPGGMQSCRTALRGRRLPQRHRSTGAPRRLPGPEPLEPSSACAALRRVNRAHAVRVLTS